MFFAELIAGKYIFADDVLAGNATIAIITNLVKRSKKSIGRGSNGSL